MKKVIATTLLTLGTISTLGLSLISSFTPVQAEENIKFICGQSFDPETGNRLPTTFAWTPRGKIAIVRWETKYFSNYSPEERCQEVSPRFQEAYNNDTINLLTNGFMNNQPVICTAEKYGDECHTLLITLRPNDDSAQVLEGLVSILNGERVGPIKHTNQRYIQIDIQEFLRTAPVEK